MWRDVNCDGGGSNFILLIFFAFGDFEWWGRGTISIRDVVVDKFIIGHNNM